MNRQVEQRYFDIKRDIEVINKGGFFCLGCIVGKKATEQSPNPLYCQWCYDSLKADGYKFDGKATEFKMAVLTTESVSTPIKEVETNMATVNDPSPSVANFRPRGRPKTYKKRSLPNEKIMQLNKQGLGSKAIASKLQKQGIDVSFRTIARILAGERN